MCVCVYDYMVDVYMVCNLVAQWQSSHGPNPASTPQGTASRVLHNRAKGRIDSWLSSGSLCDLMQVVLLEKAWNATPNPQPFCHVLPSPYHPSLYRGFDT